MSCGDCILIFVAIIFPPLVVWIKTGLCSADSCINLLLCLLGWFPGMIHAWYIIGRHPEQQYRYIPDEERQDRVTYYYITHRQGGGRPTPNGNPLGPGYGAIPHNKPPSPPPALPPPHRHNHQLQHQQHQHPNPHHQPHHQHHHHRSHSENHRQHLETHHSHHEQHHYQGQQSGVVNTSNGASSSSGNPPSYSEAIRGDHKIQRH